MFDHLLESSQRDDSNKWSNRIGFGEEKGIIDVKKPILIWSPVKPHLFNPLPIMPYSDHGVIFNF